MLQLPSSSISDIGKHLYSSLHPMRTYPTPTALEILPHIIGDLAFANRDLVVAAQSLVTTTRDPATMACGSPVSLWWRRGGGRGGKSSRQLGFHGGGEGALSVGD